MAGSPPVGATWLAGGSDVDVAPSLFWLGPDVHAPVRPSVSTSTPGTQARPWLGIRIRRSTTKHDAEPRPMKVTAS